MINRILRAGAAFLVALPLLFAQAPVTVTPTMVTVQQGLPLYCAARWSPPNVQLYCYTTVTRTWDTLIYNSLFPMTFGSVFVPYVESCQPGLPSCTTYAATMWIFSKSTAAGSTVDWQVSYNNASAFQKGTF